MSNVKLPTYSINKDLLIKKSKRSACQFEYEEDRDFPGLSPEQSDQVKEQIWKALYRPSYLGKDARGAIPEKHPLTLAGFPLDALPPVMKDLVGDLAAVHQIDPGLPAMAALGTLSGAIGRSVVVCGGYRERRTHCNLYILIGAPPSYGKSVAADIVEPLKNASEKLVDVFNEDEASELEAIIGVAKQAIKALTKKASAEDVTPANQKKAQKDIKAEQKKLKDAEFLLKHPPTYMIGSATVAAFEESLCRNKEHLFSFTPEAGERVREALGKSAPIMDFLLSGYSVETRISSTLSRGQKNITPCLSLLWMMQPALLWQFFGAKIVSERGLSARVLPLLIEDCEIPLDDGENRVRNDTLTEAWKILIRKALAGREATKELKASEAVGKTFISWNNEVVLLQNNEFKAFQHEIGRCREQAIRIAGVLATAAGSKTVTKKIAEDAVEISRWCLGQMLQILAGRELVTLEADKRELKRIINEKKDDEGWATFRDVKRSKKAITDERLRELCDKYPEELACEKRHKGYIIRLVE